MTEMHTPQGLFRSALLPPPAPLTEVFEQLRAGPHRFSDLGDDDLCFGGRVPSGDEGYWEMWSLRGEVYIVISDCSYRQAREEAVVSEGFIEFHYNLSGEVSASVPPSHWTKVGNLDLVICALGPKAHYQIRCESGRRKSVAIFVRPDRFLRYLDAESADSDTIIAEISAIKPGQIYFRRSALELNHATLLKQLMDNPYRGRRRLLYLQAKITEILCGSVDIWAEALHIAPRQAMLAARDIRLLVEARRIIQENPAHGHTIAELARLVGMNTTKFKAGFRTLHGCTVFEYVLQQRMTHALDLLVQQRMTVARTAEQVGYQHASSFSVAFQRFFGFSPKNAQRIAQSGT